jgi:multidrug efflux pump subunit AcrA (membrane-fusion protein)
VEWDSRTRLIEARLIESVELLPRMFARISVQCRVAEAAVVVPDAAIVVTPRGQKVVFAFVDGKASLRQVTVGIEQGGRVQILEGIQPGEKVVVSGNLGLKDGAPVQFGGAANEGSGGTAAGGEGK